MLKLPDCVYNWLVDFYNGHSHCTKFQGETSQLADINASVIQGSALGPAAYLINAADLHTVHKDNVLVKFADYTYLIVAAERIESRNAELQNVASWAAMNNLCWNQTKSVEIIFTKPGRGRELAKPPPPPEGITRKESVEILRVTFSNHFSTKEHDNVTLAACQQTLFALRTLRAHGLDQTSLQTVFNAVAVGKLRYASPAWYGSQARRITNVSKSSCVRARGLGIVRRAPNHLRLCVTTLTPLCSNRSYQTGITFFISFCLPGYSDTTTSAPVAGL